MSMQSDKIIHFYLVNNVSGHLYGEKDTEAVSNIHIGLISYNFNENIFKTLVADRN